MKLRTNYMRLLFKLKFVRRTIQFVGMILAASGITQAEAPTVAALKISHSITLDGRLDEAEWRAAPAITLIQQAPHPGVKTPFKTEARVLVSSDAIYFGFLCHDPNPKAIAMHTMVRDGDQSGDDSVAVVLDTYGTARVEGGWSAEIVIPSRTLSFARGRNEWGVNSQRFISRGGRTWLRWSSPTLDSFLYDLSRAGTLTGVGGLEQGKGIELTPYAAGKSTQFFGVSPRSWQASEGGDVTWKITLQLVSVFTVNTDFAETEVDSRQINLTRFPLFFPEKRAFFLEGANQYIFGLWLGQQFIPFFSRNVGLLDGVQIPLDGGVKLNGRAGKWNLAFLDADPRYACAAGSSDRSQFDRL